jgi:hypothetical protein
MLHKCGGEMKSTQSTRNVGIVDAARISNFIQRKSATIGQRFGTTKTHELPDQLDYEAMDIPAARMSHLENA